MSFFNWTKFRRRRPAAGRTRMRGNQLRCEPLESRKLLALLGLAPQAPVFTYNSTGHITYTAAAETFDLTATPLTFKDVTGPPHGVVAPRSLAIHIQVDNNGNLIGGTPGNDLEIDGTVDPDGNPADTVSGVLLTGEILGFGYLESGATDQYDLLFAPSGGLLQSYFTGSNIGMTVSSENSTFNNDFTQDFQGGAKGNIGNIPKTNPTITTSASETAAGVVGAALLADSATISGGSNPGGSITFSLTAPDGSTTAVATIPVNGNGTYDAPNVTATEVGTYTWHASYSGDNFNNGAIDDGTNESVTTVTASPTISTSASESAGGVVGTALLSDSATIAGGYNIAGGTITFTLTAPDGNTSTIGSVPVTGAGTYDAPTVPATEVGTYTWHASYSGDNFNNGAIDDGTNESVTTVKASSSISTTIKNAANNQAISGNQPFGTSVYDTATVSGAPFTPSGTVTYYFYNTATPVYGTTAPVSTQTVTLIGGNVPNSSVTGPLAAGSFSYIAVYSGNDNYTGSVGAVEPLTVASRGGTICGTKYLDQTGNGFSCDDTPLGGVKIYLDTNNNGRWDSGEPITTTAANGTYSFTGLAAGTYNVREVVPTGYVQTGPALRNGYSICLASGQTSSGNDFDDYMAACDDMSAISNIVYIINGTTAVSDLRGNTQEGQTVQVSFTVPAGSQPQTFTLVSYTAPGPTFVASQASQQEIYDLDTGTFGPGSYTLTVQLPHSYYQVDFVCGSAIDQFGPANSNIFYSAQDRLFSADNGGTHAVICNASTISGYAYVDANTNGKFDSNEQPLAGAVVTLTGTDSSHHAVSQTSLTDADGKYMFGNLPAGTYTITEKVPGGFSNGSATAGTVAATVQTGKLSNIHLSAGINDLNNDFGFTQPAAPAVTARQTGTIAFWNSSSGQALIKALNGSANATSLSNYLATNFPNLYGTAAGSHNLKGKTNSQVAAFYRQLYGQSGQKLDAETMALALATYVTNSGLAGNTATSYGFTVSASGLGSAWVNVGASGAAFGVNDNATLTVMNLLVLTNARASKGLLWDTNGDGAIGSAESVVRSQAYSLFDSINNL